jgi:2-C-methyl-D-erythritol 4-phosphate cytidylyltransferase
MAAGSGKRMGGSVKKQYLKIDGKEIIKMTAEVFDSCALVDEIVAVTGADELDYVKEILKDCNKLKAVVAGGSERQYSVYNGLTALTDCDIVLIHDGVRPFVKAEEIEKCIAEVNKSGACVLGVPVKDTIKVCDEEGNIVSTPKRSTLWAAQTPQCFRYDLILSAYESAIAEGFLGTDDASLAERMGIKVKMVEGSYNNIKITTPEDMKLGEVLKNT